MGKPATEQDNTPQRRWNRKAWKKFQASRDDAARKDDRKQLRRLFNLAAKSPELKDALEWAKEHDIRFIIDRSDAAVGGYYWVGSGVVAFSLKHSLYNDRRLAGVAVHEIRHAWQDWQGMIPSVATNFADYNMNIALIEADATTHQKFAEQQVAAAEERAWNEKTVKRRPDLAEHLLKRSVEKQQYMADKRPRFLRDGFQSWYNGDLPRIYGTTAYRLIGSKLGIPGVTPRHTGIAFTPEAVPEEKGIDVTRIEDIRRLGKGFKGGNYMGLLNRNELYSRFLSREASARFFANGPIPRAKKEDVRVMEEIRKRELLLKFERGKPVQIDLKF